MSPAPAGAVAPPVQAGFRRRQVRIGDSAFRHRIGTGLGQCPVHPGRFQAPHTGQVCRYSTPLFPAGVVCLLPTSPDHRGRERVKPVVAPSQPSSSNVCAGSRSVAKHEAVGPPFHQLPHRENGAFGSGLAGSRSSMAAGRRRSRCPLRPWVLAKGVLFTR